MMTVSVWGVTPDGGVSVLWWGYSIRRRRFTVRLGRGRYAAGDGRLLAGLRSVTGYQLAV